MQVLLKVGAVNTVLMTTDDAESWNTSIFREVLTVSWMMSSGSAVVGSWMVVKAYCFSFHATECCTGSIFLLLVY